jgi:hypothetical protein
LPDVCLPDIRCKVPIAPSNLIKYNIISNNRSIIPCSTWKDYKCESTSEFLDAHGCDHLQTCPSCCIGNRQVFVAEAFLLGTMLPVAIGVLFVGLLFVHLQTSKIKWVKTTKLNVRLPNLFRSNIRLPKISFSSAQIEKPTSSVYGTSQQERRKIPRSRADLFK